MRRELQLPEHDRPDLGLCYQTAAVHELGLVQTPTGCSGGGDAEPGHDEHDDRQGIEPTGGQARKVSLRDRLTGLTQPAADPHLAWRAARLGNGAAECFRWRVT